jgi:hypothetical protein
MLQAVVTAVNALRAQANNSSLKPTLEDLVTFKLLVRAPDDVSLTYDGNDPIAACS